jgi:hypothetical protein
MNHKLGVGVGQQPRAERRLIAYAGPSRFRDVP